MQLIIVIFIFALTGGSSAFLNATFNSSSSAAWPEPEGLPDGWRAGADVGQAGSFGRVLTDSTTRSNTVIYYPDSIGTGPKLPIVFFKHGFTAQSSQYRGIIDRMVTHGFVVVADDGGGTIPSGMANDVEATIIWFMDFTRGAERLFNRDNLDISRIGMTGHSMGGGATTYIIDRFGKPDHPLAKTEPDFYFRGGAPCQPWTLGGAASKSTEAPMLVLGGTRDTTVPPSMYTGIYSRSADLKALIEFPDGHSAPSGGGGDYTPQITDFMYAALLGDKDRWYRYFPRTN